MGRRSTLGRPAGGLPRYYLDVGWWRHPKYAGAPLATIGLMAALIGYSTEHSTDGRAPSNPEALAAALGLRASDVRKALTDLTKRGGVTIQGDTLTVEGYADHNPTRAEVEAYTAERSTAGQRGNHERWHVKRGVTDPECPLCDSLPDRSSDPPSDRGSDPTGIANGSHGMGWDRKSSSSQFPHDPRPEPDDDLALTIATARAHRLGRNSAGWIRTVAKALRAEHGDRLDTLHAQGLTTDEIDHQLDHPARPDEPLAAAQAARLHRPHCDHCGGSGHTLNANNEAIPCNHHEPTS